MGTRSIEIRRENNQTHVNPHQPLPHRSRVEDGKSAQSFSEARNGRAKKRETNMLKGKPSFVSAKSITVAAAMTSQKSPKPHRNKAATIEIPEIAAVIISDSAVEKTPKPPIPTPVSLCNFRTAEAS